MRALEAILTLLQLLTLLPLIGTLFPTALDTYETIVNYTHQALFAMQKAILGLAPGGLAPVANVLTFGADPTGATNSGAAFQNAENFVYAMGGTIVYIPPGTYLLNTTVTPRSGVMHYAYKGTVTLKRTVAGDVFATIGSGAALDSASWVGINFDMTGVGWSAIGLTGSDAAGQITNLLITDCGFKAPSITWMVRIDYNIVDPTIPVSKNRNIRIKDCTDDATGGTFTLENLIFVNCRNVTVQGCTFLNTPASLAAHTACYGYCTKVRFIGNYYENWASSRAVYVVQSDGISFLGDQFSITTNHNVAEVFNSRKVKFLGCQMETGSGGTGVIINDFGGATFDGHTNLYSQSSSIAVEHCQMDVMDTCVALNLQGTQGQSDITVDGNVVSPLRSLFRVSNMPAAPSATVRKIDIKNNHVSSHQGFSGGAGLIGLVGNAAAALGGLSGVSIENNTFAASGAGGTGTDIEFLNKVDDVTITGNKHLGSATPIVGAAVVTNLYIFNNPGADSATQGITTANIKALVATTLAAAIAPDLGLATVYSPPALVANQAVATPLNTATGRDITFIWQQDAVGGRTITYSAFYKTGGAAAFVTTLSTVTIDRFVQDFQGNLRLISRMTGQAL